MERIAVAILCGLLVFTQALLADDSEKPPFESAVVSGRSILVTLGSNGIRWLVAVGSGDESPRLSTPGEVFSLTDGTSLRMIEKHSSYLFTAKLTPEPGLMVYSVFDARPFGGEVTKKHYFLKVP